MSAERHTMSAEEKVQELFAENARLAQENWQLKQACGYSIPADKETPQNPFKCGTCEARTLEIDRLRGLFKKYINHVSAEEGSTFMPYEYDGFSAEEITALETLDAEAALAKEAK